MKLSLTKRVVPALLLLASSHIHVASSYAADNDLISHTSATELQWMESGFGPLVSPVNGDLSKGAHVTYVRFSAGMTTPLHTHTHDYIGIVLTGVSMHWEPNKPETRKKLSAGAHWFMPANIEHISECLPGTECIMAIYQQDSMDFMPVDN